jgi:NADH:ubiquinone oxidoreductase subunit
MGRAIPPEWTVNLLALGKEPWRFKDLEDQLNMCRQQWQADQQKRIITKMAGKMPGKTNEGKRKNMTGRYIRDVWRYLMNMELGTYSIN